MQIIFWILWICDLLLLLLSVWGTGFRSGFGAGTDLNTVISLGVGIILILGLVLKFSAKPQWISLLVVALPVIFMVMMYLLEKRNME